MKPVPIIAVEQPELGLAGPIAYRAYQSYEGIRLIEKKRKEEQEEEEHQEENRRRGNEVLREAARNVGSAGEPGYSSWGTYVATPRSIKSGTTEEKKPLIGSSRVILAQLAELILPVPI